MGIGWGRWWDPCSVWPKKRQRNPLERVEERGASAPPREQPPVGAVLRPFGAVPQRRDWLGEPTREARALSPRGVFSAGTSWTLPGVD
jgi:ribosome modulation factor